MSSNRYFKYILIPVVAFTIIGCVSDYSHDPPDPPYRLTDVEIRPQNPSPNDTVRLKATGEGDKGSVTSYNWIINDKVHSTPGDSLRWYEKDHNDVVTGKVEGRFNGSVFQKSTEPIEFTIRFNK